MVSSVVQIVILLVTVGAAIAWVSVTGRNADVVATGVTLVNMVVQLLKNWQRLPPIVPKPNTKNVPEVSVQLVRELDEYAESNRRRFNYAVLNSRALFVAVWFSVASCLVTTLLPPAGRSFLPDGSGPSVHILVNCVAAFVIGLLAARGVLRRTDNSGLTVTGRVGFLGVAWSGLIALAVSLPYSLDRLLAGPTISAGGQTMDPVMLILGTRLLLYPLTASIGSILAVLTEIRPHHGIRSAGVDMA